MSDILDGLIACKPQTAARVLDCGIGSVYRLIKAGKLQVVPFGADQRIVVESLKKLAAEGCARPGTAKKRSPGRPPKKRIVLTEDAAGVVDDEQVGSAV